MPKAIYCANCGLQLTITLKPLPQHERIITMVEYHECLDEPVKLDLSSPVDIPVQSEKRAFADGLDELKNVPHGPISTEDLRDRRKTEHTRSSAPENLTNMISTLGNTTPANDIGKEPENE